MWSSKKSSLSAYSWLFFSTFHFILFAKLTVDDCVMTSVMIQALSILFVFCFLLPHFQVLIDGSPHLIQWRKYLFDPLQKNLQNDLESFCKEE